MILAILSVLFWYVVICYALAGIGMLLVKVAWWAESRGAK